MRSLTRWRLTRHRTSTKSRSSRQATWAGTVAIVASLSPFSLAPFTQPSNAAVPHAPIRWDANLLPAGIDDAQATTGSSMAGEPIDDPVLRAIVDRLSGDEATTARLPGTSTSVAIEILHDDTATVDIARKVTKSTGRVTGHGPPGLLQADLPISEISDLIKTPGVSYVRSPRSMSLQPPRAAFVSAGPRTTEALNVMQVDRWHAVGRTGSGVNVGVIDYFNRSTWDIQRSTGEVPDPAGQFCMFAGQSCSVWDPEVDGHGNAVAEVIHDLAPGSALFLATADTVSDYYAVIDWFAANGVSVINRSLGTPYDGPGDGTGPMDSVVDYAASKGITWFNSAGNEGDQQYWRGSWSDPDQNGWLDFSPGDETLNISSSCFSLLGARWNDWGPPATRTDYDFYIYENGSQVYPDQAPNQQSGAPPIELDGIGGCGSGGSKTVRVKKSANGSGTVGDVLEVLSYSGTLSPSVAEFAAATSVVDSRNRAAVAVGAVALSSGSSLGQLARYSSNGPTNDLRRKPDVSAPTCFASSVFTPFCFEGTSASSPAAAGAAAVLRGAGLASTAQGLAALIKGSTVDAGAPGPDNQFGTGELRLTPPSQGSVNVAPSIFSAVTPTRILDTRRATDAYRGVQEAESLLEVPVAGAGIVPPGATAVAINLTIVNAASNGYAQVFPSRWAAVDGVSTINLETASQTLPNFAITPLGEGGRISVYLPSGGHVLVDVLGYFTPSGPTAAGRLIPLVPRRVLDTRQDVRRHPELLPAQWTNHRPVSDEVVPVAFTAVSGLPSTGVAAVVLSVTGTDAAAPGFVTAYPSGVARPDASVLNLLTGTTAANTVIVPVGIDGRVNLYTSGGSHLIADLQGYITNDAAAVDGAGRFVPIPPVRAFDTRTDGGPITERTFAIATGVFLPVGNVGAMSFNLTAAPGLMSNGFAQLFPSGSTPLGEFSNLNWSRGGQTVASGGIVRLSSDGKVTVKVLGGAQVIIDLNGYFTLS